MESLKISNRFVLSSLFVVYLGLLIKFILFRRPLDYIETCIKNMEHFSIHNINMGIVSFVPFKSTLYFLAGNEGVLGAAENLLGNFIGFMPLGLLAPLLFEEIRSTTSMIVVAFSVSLSFELVQLVTGLGIFDVDDLLLNTTGGVLGFLTYVFFTRQAAAYNS